MADADAQVGSAGCSTAHIGNGRCWDVKIFLLKDYWHGMMCAIVGGIQMGSALNKPRVSDRERNESSLTTNVIFFGRIWWLEESKTC